MSQYFGTHDFDSILERSFITYPQNIDKYELYQTAELDICETFDSEMNHLFDEQLIDLMLKMLSIDPINRPTATEALTHPFFNFL